MAQPTWAELAKKADAEGYVPGSWERLLEQSLRRGNPQLVKEMGKQFRDYLKVKCHEAAKMYERLLNEGTPPRTAHDLAVSELLDNAEPPELDPYLEAMRAIG